MAGGEHAIGRSLLVAFTIFLMLGAGASRADEGSPELPLSKEPTASAAPAVRLGKVQFNLFNPTSEDALRPDTLNLPFTTALPKGFSLTVEPAVGLLRNFYKQGYQLDYQILLNLNHPIIGEVVTAALELALDFPGDHSIGPRHTIDPSLQWLVTPNLQLDAGIYVGLTKGAPDWNPYVGISFRY